MFETRSARSHSAKDEAERPFWISYADLMTALMILFLVVMCVALFNVTHKLSDRERRATERDKDIAKILDWLEANVKNCGEAKLERDRTVIDFGPEALFEFSSNKLTLAQKVHLRECVPNILKVAESELGKKWIKRIVVEGYTDKKGSYLLNLNLSLQRSERVLCALLVKSPRPPGNRAPVAREFTAEERTQIRELFLVGGYSYNLAKDSDVDSRRVEMRLEFWGLDDSHDGILREPASADIETICPLDAPSPNVPKTVVPRPGSNPTPSFGAPLTIRPAPGR